MIKTLRSVGVVVLLITLFSLSFGVGEVQSDDKLTVTGVIKRAEIRGGSQKTVQVYIADPDQGDFLVQRTSVGKELTRIVGATIQATGYKKKSRKEDFLHVIDVLEY